MDIHNLIDFKKDRHRYNYPVKRVKGGSFLFLVEIKENSELYSKNEFYFFLNEKMIYL